MFRLARAPTGKLPREQPRELPVDRSEEWNPECGNPKQETPPGIPWYIAGTFLMVWVFNPEVDS